MADEDDFEEGGRAQWWLATLGRTIVWARMRVRDAGTAEVFDSDGNTLVYDSPDSARAALLDAEFVEYDGLDREDVPVEHHEIREPAHGERTGLALQAGHVGAARRVSPDRVERTVTSGDEVLLILFYLL